MNAVHISTMQKILQARDPISLTIWTKKGEIQHYPKCVSLHYDFCSGTRNIKMLDSGQIRKVRDVCIFQINGMEVFM